MVTLFSYQRTRPNKQGQQCSSLAGILYAEGRTYSSGHVTNQLGQQAIGKYAEDLAYNQLSYSVVTLQKLFV